MRQTGQPQPTTATKILGDHARRIRLLEFRRGGSGADRIVRGAIQNDASVIAGTGFTAEWNDEDLSSPSLNLYTIRFTESFASPGPIVAFGENNANPAGVAGEYKATLKTRDPDFIVVMVKEFDGAPKDGGFDFLAVEAAA